MIYFYYNILAACADASERVHGAKRGRAESKIEGYNGEGGEYNLTHSCRTMIGGYHLGLAWPVVMT